MNLALTLRVGLEVEHPRDPETVGNLRGRLDHTRDAARTLAMEVKRLRLLVAAQQEELAKAATRRRLLSDCC